jgi:quercetin 2,3-dioxygenase
MQACLSDARMSRRSALARPGYSFYRACFACIDEPKPLAKTTMESTAVITIRRADARGSSNHGWLDSRHTFSFADYYDRSHMGFGPLRVINEDRVAPGAGFGKHSHRDMEIISYVLEGALAHNDSLGTGSVIRPGELQRMSAGTGIQHSEFNASQSEPVHFLQIWILPERQGMSPGYEQKSFALAEATGLVLLANREGRGGGLTIHQDVEVYGSMLAVGRAVQHTLSTGRIGWVQVARGEAILNGLALAAGDGAAIEAPIEIRIETRTQAEILLFDMIH